jgi:hypothetical protein
MIKALQENFQKSLQATDENSRAYSAVLRGEIPLTSLATHTHVASRLLTLRFLDIYRALDKDIEIKDVSQKNTISVLKSNVCLIFHLWTLFIAVVIRTCLTGWKYHPRPFPSSNQPRPRIAREQILDILQTLSQKIRG